jgi:hypothetical protein
MPNNKDDRFNALKGLAVAAPLSYGVSSSVRKMADKGYFTFPKPMSTSGFIGTLQKSSLSSNSGIDLSFLGQNQQLFKTQPELARTAWIEAVQSTDPLASNVLSFAGDIKTAPTTKVMSSIEQTLQRNNSIFMARIYNKFKSNVASLRKHYELTGNIPKFKTVEGLTFPAPRNVSINQLPAEIASFHKSFVKDAGLTSTGVRYYTRQGWQQHGTYVMSFMKGKIPFDITVPVARGGVLIEGLTQSARRIAPDVGIFDPRTGQMNRLSRHEFLLRDIQQSILPRIASGEYTSRYDIERAISTAYERNIYALESIPNLPENLLSPAWKSYQRIKGQGLDIVTEGKLAELRPGEVFRSVYSRPTEEQFKAVMSRPELFPFASPVNLAKGRVSSFNASEWFMTPEDIDWARQPRQALRQWRASDKAVSEMLTSGSSKWSIFETQAWRRDFGNYATPWMPTVYVDPVKHGQMLEQLGMKEGEALIANVPSFRRQLGVVGQPFPIHLGSVAEGVAERIFKRDVFQVGEVLGQTPEGKSVIFQRGMELLGLQPFETTARGQEFSLMYRQALAPEMAAKRFGGYKAVEKFIDPFRLEKAFAQTGLDITQLEGRFRVVSMDELTKDAVKLNTQVITGLWEKIRRDRSKNFIQHNQRLAAFMRNPRVYSSFMRRKYGPQGFMEQMMGLAVKEVGLEPEEFGTIFGALSPEAYQGVIPQEFAKQMTGISFGLSQGILHEPMAMTGAGALGSIEPRVFDVLKGGQYGPLGESMSTELARRLALSNPETLATYEGLTKTLASLAGKTGSTKGAALWDIGIKGYSNEAFQQFIESGGGFLRVGAGYKDIFVPGADVLTPYKTPAGKYIPGVLAMEYHGLAREMSKLTLQSKRVDLEAAGNVVNNFVRNIMTHQAPFGKGEGAIARGQLLGSRFLRGVSETGGHKAPGVMTVGIPQYIGEQMFEDLASITGAADIKSVQEMNKRFLAGQSIGGMIWRHPIAGPYSAQPINIQMMKDIREPVVVMPSVSVDIGMKNPIELSPMVGMGMDLDADIASVSLVSPDLEKNIRKGFTYADNQYTQAYMEHMVRAQIIKTKAAGGAELLATQEKKIADALKLATGQQWIGRLSLQMHGAKQAAVQRLKGQQAANVAFTLNWLEESIIKSKHLSRQKVLSDEMSVLLAKAESAFQAKDPVRLEQVIRNMLAESDEVSRALLDQEVRIPKNIERIREITGVKSMRDVLPAVNIKETTRDMMNAMEWAETTGLEEMSRIASARKAPSITNLGKYLSFTGSVLSSSKGAFTGVSEGFMRAKNFAASMGMGLIEHKKALGWGLAGSLAIGLALSKPEDLIGSGADLVPNAKTVTDFNKATQKMTAENILPPEAPLGEPTVPSIMVTPSARILPGAENRNINIRARSSSRTNAEDMVRKYRRSVSFNRMNVNVRDNRSRLSKYDIADRILT